MEFSFHRNLFLALLICKEETSLSIWHLKRKQKGKNTAHVTVVSIHLWQVFPRPPRGKPFSLCRNSLHWLFHSSNCQFAAHVISEVYLHNYFLPIDYIFSLERAFKKIIKNPKQPKQCKNILQIIQRILN